jgi:hypothetical protein
LLPLASRGVPALSDQDWGTLKGDGRAVSFFGWREATRIVAD